MGSGGGRGKGRARGAPADPPARPCAPHGCNENTVTGTLGVARRDKGRHRGTRGDIEEGGDAARGMGSQRGGRPPILGLGGTAASIARQPGSHLHTAVCPCVAPPPSCLISIQAATSQHLSPTSSTSFAYRPRLQRYKPRPLVYIPAAPTCFAYSPTPLPFPIPARLRIQQRSSRLSFTYRPHPLPSRPPLPLICVRWPRPPLRPAHLGALRGAVGADELHEVLERILPVVVADGGVGEVRPRLGQEGARREVQRRGCGPRAACRDPQCSGAPPSPPNRAHP